MTKHNPCDIIITDTGTQVILCNNLAVNEFGNHNLESCVGSKTVFLFGESMQTKQQKRESHRIFMAGWSKRNPDRIRLHHKRYRKKHKEKLVEENRLYLEMLHKKENITMLQASRYSKKRVSARNRGIEFLITREEYISLWGKPCVYCGKEIELIAIDRTDNNKGYIMSNLKPCCFSCNKRKYTMTEQEFLSRHPKIKEGIYGR